jgi:hypothetical protein
MISFVDSISSSRARSSHLVREVDLIQPMLAEKIDQFRSMGNVPQSTLPIFHFSLRPSIASAKSEKHSLNEFVPSFGVVRRLTATNAVENQKMPASIALNPAVDVNLNSI